MAERLSNMDSKKAAVPHGEDRLSALPEEVILLLLSFLPTREAVQTCLLGPRWRNLWKSVPSLLLNTSHSADFINCLILCRDPTPLHKCVILFEECCIGEGHQDAERWLRYVLSCKVRDLRFDMLNCSNASPLSAGALASEHLTRLDLFRIKSEDFSLDVSSCHSLEELEIYQSTINIGNTGTGFPKSLRLLIIRDAKFHPEDTRSSISAPGLVNLELVDCLKWTPFLEHTPSLVKALIRITRGCIDSSYAENFCGVKGLLGATNLELLSPIPSSTIFRTEIKWSPIFSKLKTLLLCDWFITANFSGLVYFLQHSPVLEMLTLQLSVYSKNIKATKVYKPKKQFLVSEHLKVVYIKYYEEFENIDQILNVLAYHGVQAELINIDMHPYKACNYFEDYYYY